MTRRKNPPIESFDPRFIQWWIDGSRQPVSVVFPTRSAAYDCRLNVMYKLRKVMRQTDHYAARVADRAEAVIRPVKPTHAGPRDPHYLTIRPAQAKYSAVLEASGIKLRQDTDVDPTPDEDPTEDPND